MYKNIVTQNLRKPLLRAFGLEADVLRLDLIHPVVSGNKWFKLKYHLRQAKQQGKNGMVSFGGAYSNHLVAMAYACKEHAMRSAAIIRGDEEHSGNDSIQQMRNAGMELIFTSRDAYRNKEKLKDEFLSAHEDFYYVPEGGQSAEGIQGAGEILSLTDNDYTDIICPVGTGTTITGIINASENFQKITGISAIKIPDPSENDLLRFIANNASKNNYKVLFNYHFGGYAKKTNELVGFMNNLYRDEGIPTDFVYTGKMFYAVFDLLEKKYFSPGSRLLIIHTGGLQGNRSLPQGTLVF